MIHLKNSEQISAMKEAGRITAEALILAGEAVKEGITTKHLDDIIRHHIEKSGAKPSFLGYAGFPGSACISINDEVIHGIPSKDRVIYNGDIVKIDVGAYYKGFHGDSARTYGCGTISREAQLVIEAAQKSFEAGFDMVRENNRIGDVAHAVQTTIEGYGFGVIRKYIGHGVGHELHESPDVPNYGAAGRGPRIVSGMTFAIEPMVTVGDYEVRELANGWTVVTQDHSLTSHYENTVALTDDGPIILTKVD